ncbi:MAG: hypothetical protein LBC62_09490 [Treponema sp.]|nr:hypothetical protein [Treponema sp.]
MIEKIRAKIEEAAEGEGSLILSPFCGFPYRLNTDDLDAALRGAGPDKLLRIKKLDISGSKLTELPVSIGMMKNLEILDASYTPLESLPKVVGTLVYLKQLDISRTEIERLPHSLVNCQRLAYSRRHVRALSLLSSLSRRLAEKSGFFRNLQERLYSCLYQRLDELQQDLDICGWRENQGNCRRNRNQCCSSGGSCEYLGKSGCSVKSLACKIWLCEEALGYIKRLESGGNRRLRKRCRKYLRMRRRYDEICRILDIRFKGRASKEQVFDPDCTNYQNTSIDRWYDNISHRLWGQFISLDDACRERKGLSPLTVIKPDP